MRLLLFLPLFVACKGDDDDTGFVIAPLDTSDTDTEFFIGTDGYGADDLASEDLGESISSDEARAIMRESEVIRALIRRGA